MLADRLSLKKQELTHRVDAVPAEVAAWKQATEAELDKNAHFSQLHAIDVLVRTLVDEQRRLLGAVDPASPQAFGEAALAVSRSIIKTQRCWDFFRDKLDLRHAPAHKEPLWVADTIAWDCHRPVMDLAVQLGIVSATRVREPPLVYCTAEYSPATWVRGSRPNDGRSYDLGEARVPIPVIELPWDHLSSAWEWLSLHHEVGHDIEADLGLRPALREKLQQALAAAQVPASRIATWLKWQGEVFADLCALRLGGPAFADALVHLLLLPPGDVKTFDPADPHPTPYPRILLNAAYVRTLGPAQEIQDHAARVEGEWRDLYGPTSGDPELDALSADFPVVFGALMEAALPALKDHRPSELLPFGAADDAAIRGAVKYLRSGMNKPSGLRIRHVPSAARLAVADESAAGTLNDAACAAIHARVLKLVRDSAPLGLLRGGGPGGHDQFIASFARRMFSE